MVGWIEIVDDVFINLNILFERLDLTVEEAAAFGYVKSDREDYMTRYNKVRYAAKKAEKEGMAVSLVSGDRDLLQIATKSIKIRIPKTKGARTEI